MLTAKGPFLFVSFISIRLTTAYQKNWQLHAVSCYAMVEVGIEAAAPWPDDKSQVPLSICRSERRLGSSDSSPVHDPRFYSCGKRRRLLVRRTCRFVGSSIIRRHSIETHESHSPNDLCLRHFQITDDIRRSSVRTTTFIHTCLQYNDLSDAALQSLLNRYSVSRVHRLVNCY